MKITGRTSQSRSHLPEKSPSLPWLSPAVGVVWGALLLSLSRITWIRLSDRMPHMWTAWINSPDFMWLPFLQAMAGHLAGLFLVALMLVASYGAGRPLARFLGAGSGLNRIFLQTALGWGVLSFIQQGLGYPGLFFPGLFRVEVVALALLGAAVLWHDQPWRELARADWRAEWPRLFILGAIISSAYLLSRMPDVDEDARLYHLAGPESYLLIHKISAVPGHFAWHMPFGAEMDFIVPYALGGITLAKQVNIAVLIALLGLVWRLSVALGRGSLWSAVWAGTAGLILNQCWDGKNDLVLAMYCTGSALCAVEASRGSRKWLVPSAWLAGLAFGVKLTAGLFTAGLVAGLALFLFPRLPAKRWAFLMVPGLAPFIGWLGASWLFLGNPFHPFLSGIFPELGWGPFYSGWLNFQARAISPAEALMKRDWLLGIWRGIGMYDHGSIALFGLAPLALLGRKSREDRLLIACILAIYLAWLPSHRNARYLFPIVPLVAALASGGSGATGIFSGWGARWRGVLGVYALVVSLMTLVWVLVPSGHLYLLGQSSAGDVLKGRFTSWEEMRAWANRSIPPSGKLLLSGEERRLWFNCRTVSNGPVFEPPFWKWTRESDSPPEVRKKIRQAGFTHLVHNFVSGQYRRIRWFPGPEWDDRQLKLFMDFASRYMAPAWRSSRTDNANGGFQAYTFSPVPLARPAPLFFLPSTEGIFWSARHAADVHRFRDAAVESERALARMPGVREAEYLHGGIVYLTGDNALAFRILEPGVREGFVTSHNIVYVAATAFAMGRTDVAMKLFALEARMSPGPEANWRLAATLLAQSQSAMIRRDFRRAWHDAEAGGNLAPGDARFRLAAADALRALGRHGEEARFLAEGKRLAGIRPEAPARSMMDR